MEGEELASLNSVWKGILDVKYKTVVLVDYRK